MAATRFSALQRAENSSILPQIARPSIPRSFQCSSASRKFLNARNRVTERLFETRFSALQRAENSSIDGDCQALRRVNEFQCSSASRKFLNRPSAERRIKRAGVSVLFSEPKIPQSYICHLTARASSSRFSALQRAENSSIIGSGVVAVEQVSFSALQRAENSSIAHRSRSRVGDAAFQCSSASRKFLNPNHTGGECALSHVSVLFSEPKIPQSSCAIPSLSGLRRFSALQRAENSSISTCCRTSPGSGRFQCSSASRKFLNSISLPSVA